MIKDKGAFIKGFILAITFVGILILIFSPVFGVDREGKPRNGLQYSDNLFNRLAKGSSYFISGLRTGKVPSVSTEPAKLSYKLKDVKGENPAKDQALIDHAIKIATASGACMGQVMYVGDRLELTVNVKALLEKALDDSDLMYHNNGAQMASLYGLDEKEAKPVMKAWWNLLNGMIKELQKQNRNADAEAVNKVITKAVEPAYNFYKIQAQKVAERAFTLIGLLVFYVAYTMWWGFAIFFMFEGFGLSTKKAKVKKEV